VRVYGNSNPGAYINQPLVLIEGHAYTVRFRARAVTAAVDVLVTYAGVGGTAGLDAAVTIPSTQWQNFSLEFVAAAGGDGFAFWHRAFLQNDFDLDDIVLTDDTLAAEDHLDAPWSAAQLAALQYDQDLTKNQMMFVHGNVQPRLLSLTSHGTWELKVPPFVTPPATWVGTNWPAAIDWGFQGRLWLGAAPDAPNTFLGSKSGAPFNFALGGTNEDDPVSYIASVRGRIRWMQGQKVLLMGAERAEVAASGGASIIKPGNVNVEDESAFGSAAIQAAHIGDEVIFVGREGRALRALSFDAQTKNGWVMQAISFVGEHLFASVKEVHFARSPDPTIFVLMTDGALVACTYDRAQKVIAWWRVMSAVNSAAVLDTTAGAEVWEIVTRGGETRLQIMPLHESGVEYLDAWVVATNAGVKLTGLSHLIGEEATVLEDGAYLGKFVVDAAGKIGGFEALEGTRYVAGVSYRAWARTLPVEGGNPMGTSQGVAIHFAEITARLNNSARPLINGERATLGKAFNGGTDKLEELITKDVRVKSLKVEEGGQIDIEQDMPFRTEVCALFGRAEVGVF
jgi:hypothetical protein